MTGPKHLAAFTAIVAIGAIVALAPTTAEAQGTSFFVTSENPGTGGNLGGLAGADAHCQMLAAGAGAGDRTWRAYLSTDTVDARDRIGSGPWHNAAGVQIASSVANLHSADNNLTIDTALDENGDSPNYVGGPQPLEHDVLTGTMEDGTAADATCNNWTDGTGNSTAMLGHADRIGLNPGVSSWVQAHESQGCAMENLTPTGGAGLYYCFATD